MPYVNDFLVEDARRLVEESLGERLEHIGKVSIDCGRSHSVDADVFKRDITDTAYGILFVAGVVYSHDVVEACADLGRRLAINTVCDALTDSETSRFDTFMQVDLLAFDMDLVNPRYGFGIATVLVQAS